VDFKVGVLIISVGMWNWVVARLLAELVEYLWMKGVEETED